MARKILNWRPNLLGEFLGSTQVAELLKQPAVSDEHRVDALLDLANGDPLWDSVWESMQDSTTNDSGPDAAIQREILEGEYWRKKLVPALEAALAGGRRRSATGGKISRPILSLLNLTQRGLVSIPVVVNKRGHVHLEHRVVAKDTGAAIGYTLGIVLSDPFVSRLHRCQFSECQRFFLAPDLGSEAGRRRDRFCRESCAEEGARERSRNAMRRLRSQRRRKAGGSR